MFVTLKFKFANFISIVIARICVAKQAKRFLRSKNISLKIVGIRSLNLS
ncbi:hypothetical protein [Campylobacter sp. CS_ED2]|nr:hypothetical protein [Campylobacter sp. CS_ED2]